MTTGLRRDPVIQARLDAWARWLQGAAAGHGRGGGGHPLAMLMDLHSGRRVTTSSSFSLRTTVPCDAIECDRTDQAVKSLPMELRQAVHAWHGDIGTLDGVAKRLGIVRATLHRRLCQADQRIAQWLADHKPRRSTAA